MLKDFTSASFPAKNPISLVFEVLIARHFVARVPLVKESVEVADLVFAYKAILQCLKLMLDEAFD